LTWNEIPKKNKNKNKGWRVFLYFISCDYHSLVFFPEHNMVQEAGQQNSTSRDYNQEKYPPKHPLTFISGGNVL
jgi:hypothetical protein